MLGRVAVAALILIAVLAGPVRAASLQGGLDAYNRSDYVAALKEWRPLAEQGHALAQFSLGLMYYEGQGVAQDHGEALKWFRRAAEQGLAEAQFNLGIMYDEGQGVPQDYAEAAKWTRRAAEQGNAKAQNNLGLRYDNGQGVPQDYGEAAKWFRRAADRGDADAQNSLGDLYGAGRGVPQDEAEAVKWYRRAADQGNADAQSALGVMYNNGSGVPKDYVLAHMWLNLGIAGLPRGYGKHYLHKMLRDLLEELMTPTQLAEAQRRAREWRPKQHAVISTPPAPDTALVRQRIARIQHGLASLGYDPGPADGVLGPRSRAAIRGFESREGLPVTGMISERLEAALRSASPAVASTTPPAPGPLKKVATGSGFIVSRQGHILTNEHVVAACREVRVAGTGNAAQMATDETVDLALLKVGSKAFEIRQTEFAAKRALRNRGIGTEDKGDLRAQLREEIETMLQDLRRNAAQFRGGRGVRTGEDIVVVGYPLQGILTTEMNATKGTVSALAGPGDDQRIIQITAPVQPGNSGGPVLDTSGNVVGVVVGKLDAIKFAMASGTLSENVNFAISEGAARAFLDDHDVPYETAPSTKPIPTADIAANAKGYTVLIECWK